MAHPGHHRLSGEHEASSSPLRRAVATGSAVVLLGALILAGIVARGTEATGTPRAASSITPTDGDSVRFVPQRLADDQAATGDAGLIAAIVADLGTYWSEALPPITHRPFQALRGGLTAMDSNAETGSTPCVSRPVDIVGNAYYCPSDDGIVYDATTLVPVVLHRYGIGGLITTFAHEFGHAAQARILDADDEAGAAAGTITTEARADCDAGAFVAWAVAGDAPHLTLDPGVLTGAIGPLVDFSDPPSVAATDSTAHGLAIDRLTWFLTGYRHGAEPCADLSGPRVTTLGRIAAKDDPTAPPRFASTTAVLAAATRSVRMFVAADRAASRDLLADPPNGDPVTVSPALLAAAAPHGQFAAATLAAAQFAADHGDGQEAAACFAGAWVRSVFGHAPTSALGGRPGDVDEGLAAVLLLPGDAFDAASGYADGFSRGAAAC